MRAFHPIVFLLLLSLVAFAPLGCIIVPDPTKDSGDGVVEIDPNAMNGQNDNNAMIIVPTESDNNVNTEPENNVASEPGNNENIDPGNNETPADNAPVFLDFSASTSTLTDKNEVTFVAVLTDPDGIDDLIGGSLQHPGGGSYGAFQTSAAEGSYQIIIDWDDVNSAEELAYDSELSGSLERTFVAKFYDEAGNVVERSITLGVECVPATRDYNAQGVARSSYSVPRDVCEPGRCIVLETDDDCMECGNTCPTDGPSTVGDETNDDENSTDTITMVGTRSRCDARRGGCTVKLQAMNPRDGMSCEEICGEWKCVNASGERRVSGMDGNHDFECGASYSEVEWFSCTCRHETTSQQEP